MKKNEIVLSDNFGDLTLRVNGIIVHVSADGKSVEYSADREDDDSTITPQPTIKTAPTNDYMVTDYTAGDHTIGQPVEGKGIYLGIWEPRDDNDIDLYKSFNLYAAPSNLLSWAGTTCSLPIHRAIKRVAKLEDWYDHDGGLFEDQHAVYDAVRNNPEALEQWFTPTQDILEKYIYRHKEQINRAGEKLSGPWHWSCTSDRKRAKAQFFKLNISNGHTGWGMSCTATRPVRAELRATKAPAVMK